MKASIAKVTFIVGPERTEEGMRLPALTLKPSSPLYIKDDWTNPKGEPTMMTAYSSIGKDYEDIIKLCKKETGLEIGSYDTHYCLSFDVSFDEPVTGETIMSARAKLEEFVDRHFSSYIPTR